MSNIIICTDSISASSGGLGLATLRLTAETAKAMVSDQFTILTNQSSGVPFVLEDDIPSNLSINIFPCFSIFGYKISLRSFFYIFRSKPDIIHLRGLWSFHSIAVKFFLLFTSSQVSLIVQPAGMLEDWSLKQRKLVKRIHFVLFEKFLFHRSCLVHAASEDEKNALIVRKFIAADKVFVIPTGVDIPSSLSYNNALTVRQKSPLTLLFLSRLHYKKGPDLLLKAFSDASLVNWSLVIVGSGLPNYLEYLKKLACDLSVSDKVHFLGHLDGEQKVKVFSEAHAFVLSSYSENFGIAILEAMSWGLPVITTTGTPWSSIIDFDMGFYVEPNLQQLSKSLKDIASLSESDLAGMGERARNYAIHNYSWQRSASFMKTAFQEALDVTS